MNPVIKDFDLLDVRVGIFNYRNLKRVDWFLSILVVALALIGLAVLYSSSRTPSSATPYSLKQAVFLAGGMVLALLVVCIDSRFLVSMAPLFYVCAVALLVGVILKGEKINGARRWLQVGSLRLQPAEETKVIVIYMLTWYLGLVKDRIRKFPYLIPAFVIAGLPAALIFKQPSLGTAMSLAPVCIVMVYIAGCKWWHLLAMFLAVLIAAPFAYARLEDFQRTRIYSFLDPEAAKPDDVLQTMQSKITVGSGGLSGKGFCQGTQTRLQYLPEYHTDFIFSHLAEEHGFVGAVIVIGLFAVLLLRGLRLALDATDPAGSLVAAGVVTILAFHVFVNVAITVGLMPVTGIPLPFLSYGGNFYLTVMACIGMLLSVPVRRQFFE